MQVSKKILGYVMWIFWGPFYLLGQGISWTINKFFMAIGYCFVAMAEVYEGEQDSHENFYWKLGGGTMIVLIYGVIAIQFLASHWMGWLVAQL
jgi:hypothetical protein